MTSHNSFFGWIHGFKFNQNNIVSASANYVPSPYHPVIEDPSMNQIFQNWNLADTGVTIATVVFTALFSIRAIRKDTTSPLL
jgi:hypothetical protein